MKKILSLTLAVMLLVSAIPTAFAADVDYTQGTQVVYTATGSESYTITVPALLAPGGNGTVTLEGTWADNRIITVTAEPTVTLTNSIKADDQKVLDVTFAGISEAGSNTGSQTFTEGVAVAAIKNALFGTWSGKFNYNVEVTNALVNVRDLYEHQSGYVNYIGNTLDDGESVYIRVPVNERESWFIWLDSLNRLGSTPVRFENSSNELIEYINMQNQPKYQYNPDSSTEGAVIDIPTGAAYMCVTLKFASYWDVTNTAIIAKVDNTATSTWMVFGDSLTEFNNTANRNWLSLSAKELSANYYNLAVSGTGYVHTNSVNVNFVSKIESSVADVEPELIVLFGSFNDIYTELPIGTVNDTYIEGGENSLAANMNHMYDLIQAKYPNAKIAVITPTPWSDTTPHGTNDNSIKAQQYVSVMREICETRNIPCLDLFHNSGLEPWSSSFNNQYFDNADGCHPNDAGHQIVASRVIPFLKNVLNDNT